MSEMINDWAPETKSLLERLIKAGFELRGGDNGEEQFKYDGDMAKFIANLTACDESRLYVKREGSKPKWLYLVYGNSPGELVSDYLVDEKLDEVAEAHFAEWESKEQPKCPSPYRVDNGEPRAGKDY